MGIFNSRYDENSNPKDSAGYSYDRNTGSHLGRVDRGENFGERFLGKLAPICFIIYVFPGFIIKFSGHHPEIRQSFWRFFSFGFSGGFEEFLNRFFLQAGEALNARVFIDLF